MCSWGALRNLSGKPYKDYIGEHFCSSALQSWSEINYSCAAQVKIEKKEKKSENGLISKLRSPIPSETLRHRGETVELSAVEVT